MVWLELNNKQGHLASTENRISGKHWSPPTQNDVVNETMKRNITLAEECKECYIATTYDLAIAKPACQLQDTIQPKYDNVFVCFGAFHIMFRYLSAIGYLVDSSGAGHILMESGALTKGSLNAS